MAKKSMIAREKKRALLVEKYSKKRAALKEIIRVQKLDKETVVFLQVDLMVFIVNLVFVEIN